MTMHERLQPIVTQSGFRMEGYYVWCGSVLHENGVYYLFAARWKEETGFPQGYMTDSEIVLATTKSLDEPFQFQKVLITGRGGDFWDGQMAHNPFILKAGDRYVMFYIGTPDGSAEKRAIGYAYADRPDGEWHRSAQALDLPSNANDPSVLLEEDGRVLLYFRDGSLKVSVASAPELEGPYTVLNDCLFTKGMIEDMYVYRQKDGYVMLAEDAGGVYTGLAKGGVLFRSQDGIHWDEAHPEQAYTFEVMTDRGEVITLQRRERPMLLQEETQDWLFTTAKVGGKDRLSGGKTWNMVQRLIKE